MWTATTSDATAASAKVVIGDRDGARSELVWLACLLARRIFPKFNICALPTLRLKCLVVAFLSIV